MIKKTVETSTQTGCAQLTFPVEREYACCVAMLKRAGIITILPKSESLGVIGVDGKEYPVPTQEQVLGIFVHNWKLVEIKVTQGFDRLELTALAVPISVLLDLMKTSIIRHGAEGKIYQTRRASSDPLVPVRVNKEKQVWIWETLRQKFDINEVVYFPQEYSNNHRGQTKLEAIKNNLICAVPGWSVGLVESSPIMPAQSQGRVMGGRKQFEIGLSPNEYIKALQEQIYQGETGKTLEDFIVKFITCLEETNEVSNDVDDNNALWCIAQYIKIPYAEIVPTGRWHRPVGRVRLDAHRTNNKLCTKNFGAATTVRLSGV